jgi:hypothetical protein
MPSADIVIATSNLRSCLVPKSRTTVSFKRSPTDWCSKAASNSSFDFPALPSIATIGSPHSGSSPGSKFGRCFESKQQKRPVWGKASLVVSSVISTNRKGENFDKLSQPRPKEQAQILRNLLAAIFDALAQRSIVFITDHVLSVRKFGEGVIQSGNHKDSHQRSH